MSSINLSGTFTGGTGSVSWCLQAVNSPLKIEKTENTSFNTPISVPPGLYTLLLTGSCAKKFVFDTSGDINSIVPNVPDTITDDGGHFHRAYAILIV